MNAARTDLAAQSIADLDAMYCDTWRKWFNAQRKREPNAALVAKHKANLDAISALISERKAADATSREIVLETFRDCAVVTANGKRTMFTGPAFKANAREFAISLR